MLAWQSDGYRILEWRAREMIWSVKCLSPNHEDMSSCTLNTHVKNLGSQCHLLVIPSLGRWRQEGPWGQWNQ